MAARQHPWLADVERLRARTRESGLVDAEGRSYSHGTTTCLFLEAAA